MGDGDSGFLSKDKVKGLFNDGKLDVKRLNAHIENSIPGDIEMPTAKVKLNDDEFMLVLGEIAGKQLPIASLDELLPYKMKRDKRGRFSGLPGGLTERAMRLGNKLSYNTFDEPETEDIYIQIDLIPLTEEEVKTFMTKRQERLDRSYAKDDTEFRRVKCDECNRRVQVGRVEGVLKVFCGCEETPLETFDLTEVLDYDRKRKWR